MEPPITLRGATLNRYQGDRGLSNENEIGRRISPRWHLVGFAGVGRSWARDTTTVTGANVSAYGIGARYRIASLFGSDLGIGPARGLEETVVYFQFGHTWGRNMD